MMTDDLPAGCAVLDDNVPAKLGSARLAPPSVLNLVLAALIILTELACLWAVAHQPSPWRSLGIAIVFSFVFLPLYSLVHEAEHRTLIMVTHDPSAAAFAGRQIVLCDGKVAS